MDKIFNFLKGGYSVMDSPMNMRAGVFWETLRETLQVLVTEIYKVKNGIAPDIMNDIFELQNPLYNLR